MPRLQCKPWDNEPGFFAELWHDARRPWDNEPGPSSSDIMIEETQVQRRPACALPTGTRGHGGLSALYDTMRRPLLTLIISLAAANFCPSRSRVGADFPAASTSDRIRSKPGRFAARWSSGREGRPARSEECFRGQTGPMFPCRPEVYLLADRKTALAAFEAACVVPKCCCSPQTPAFTCALAILDCVVAVFQDLGKTFSSPSTTRRDLSPPSKRCIAQAPHQLRL